MNKFLIPLLAALVCLSGCQGEWWKPQSAVAPPTEIVLARDETWSRLTPHKEISVSGSGTSADPYVYNVPLSLNLNGHNIAISAWQGMAAWGPSVCAIFHVNGSILGGGNIDASSQGRSGGRLEITTTGGMALKSLSTGGSKDGQGGDVSLNAGGPIELTGYINTAGSSGGGNVKLQCSSLSIGQYNRCSIYCPSPARTIGNLLLPGKALRGGSVSIDTAGAVSLQGSIVASGGAGGEVAIRNAPGGRSQAVSIGGDINIASQQAARAKLMIASNSLFVGGRIIANGQSAPGAEVDIDCTGDCRIRGYVRTDSASSSSGHVRLQGRHIWIEGVSPQGWSIYAKPGSARDSQSGDGNVVLQCTDTSRSRYDPANPLEGPTSSILVAGKIVTGYAGANVRGEALLDAVELQLGGDVQIGISNERTLELHYGIGRFGYTHLVERGVRWDGTSEHNIHYGAAIPSFLPDVPYAGIGR